MVVIAIIGLVAAMGMPSIIKALQKDGMRKALSDFQDVCFTARERAIFSHQKTSVLIHPAQGDFSVDGAAAGTVNHGKVAASTLPDDIKFAMLDIFRQDYLESDWARIFFYPDGTCDESVVVLLGRGDGTFQTDTKWYASAPWRIVAGDFNGDGKLDVAVIDGAISILLGNGDGTFKNAVSISIIRT